MALSLLMALQAAPALAAPIPADFDLATLQSADSVSGGARCRGAGDDEIVVCGRRRSGGGEYPFEEMERRYAAKPIVAETDLGGGRTARAYVESATMPNGEISKRIMVGVKLPF